jgi:hypothetical protein
MANPNGAYSLALAPCELQDELYLALSFGPEDRCWSAQECATAILEHSSGRGSVDGDGLQKLVKPVKRNVR